LIKSAPQAVETEKSVFETRTRKIAQDIDVLTQQENRLTENLKLLNREVELTRRLYAQKVVPEIEMIRLEGRASETRGQLAETQSRIANVKTAFRSQADEDLAKSKGDLAVLDENIKSAQDRVRRTELQAPVYGIVNKINLTTIGAVVQPAANLIEIGRKRIAFWRKVTRVGRIGIGTPNQLQFHDVMRRHHAGVAGMKLFVQAIFLELIEKGVNAIGYDQRRPLTAFSEKVAHGAIHRTREPDGFALAGDQSKRTIDCSHRLRVA